MNFNFVTHEDGADVDEARSDDDYEQEGDGGGRFDGNEEVGMEESDDDDFLPDEFINQSTSTKNEKEKDDLLQVDGGKGNGMDGKMSSGSGDRGDEEVDMDALKSQAAYGNVASKYSKKRGRDDGAGADMGGSSGSSSSSSSSSGSGDLPSQPPAVKRASVCVCEREKV